MPDDKQLEFQVTDRRRLTPEGELRDGAESSPAPGSTAPQPQPPPSPLQQKGAASPQEAKSDQAARKYAQDAAGFEQLTFEKIVLSFAQTAMLQLGLLSADPSQPTEPDLYGARETIDMLGVFQEKTRGNLSPQEQRLLDNSLYELRMAWMELSRRFAKAKGS